MYEKLVKWKESADRKPLILKGVRQCGKTYLLKEFGKNMYADTAYFNFEGNTPLQACFDKDLDVGRIVEELGILRKKNINPADTLLIFDEIQFCNNALTSLKYFAENMPGYHIACAGSLLGIALSKPLSFPVGKIDFLTLHPMDFYEFLLANGEDMLCEYLEKHDLFSKLPEAFSEKLEMYLRNYFITGGMPEVVMKWTETKNIEKVESTLQQIIDSYELDFAKHAPKNDFPKLSLIWHSIPEQLANESGKFMFSRVKHGMRAKDLEDAMQWIISAGLAIKTARIEKPGMPLSAYAEQGYFKLYMADIGVLRRMSKLPPDAFLAGTDTFTEFKGALTENYVLCGLFNMQEYAPYYWKSGNTAEVDFVTQFGTEIVPIEVKSGKNDRSKSLAEYKKKYKPAVSMIISMNEAQDGEIKKVPLYLLWKIKDIFKKLEG
jgi:hypothetical protein